MQALQRTAFSGPALVRLLARVSASDVHESTQSLFERLSEWLSWTDAIALSNALDGAPPATGSRAGSVVHAEEEMCAEVRASLARAIAEDGVFALLGRRGPARLQSAPAPAPEVIEYGVIRQHYVSTQHLMEARIADLRDRLRRRLAAYSTPAARMAALDVTMERALGERARTLFGAVPTLLEGHFKRLQRAEHEAQSNAHDSSVEANAAQDAWLDVFRKDMQSALLAELAIRFQPVEGLLAALRTR